MFRTPSRIPLAVAALAATTLIAACGSSLPSSSTSSGQPSQAQIQQANHDAVAFANCMRAHGVTDFPDPTSSPHAFKDVLQIRTPAVQSAETACHRLLPNPGRGSQNAPPSHAQLAAELAFARCLRSHGFPSFPDPSSTGELSHEMLAAAGINIHQPAVVQAADACVSVTHGFLTRAAVARFVAGN